MPSIGQDCDTKTKFCPQPCIPTPPCEGEDFGTNSTNNQCLAVCEQNDSPKLNSSCPAEAQQCLANQTCPPAIECFPVTPNCPQQQECSPKKEISPPKKLFFPPKKVKPAAIAENCCIAKPEADELCLEANENSALAQCGDVSSRCDKPTRDLSCERPAHCKRNQSPVNKCGKNVQFPSVCEEAVCRDKQKQCWTQCPSILEDPPYACARNNGTQCPSQSQDYPCRPLAFEKLASPKRRLKNMHSKESRQVESADVLPSVPRKARSRRSNVRHEAKKSACERFQCDEAIRCEIPCDTKTSKQFNNNNQQLASKQATSEEEKSLLPDKMACNRNYNPCSPSTSCCGGESLTDLVQKAVCSIINLKASLRDNESPDPNCCNQTDAE